jgi:hypothetical protein
VADTVQAGLGSLQPALTKRHKKVLFAVKADQARFEEVCEGVSKMLESVLAWYA